jgi:hypothetical protein
MASEEVTDMLKQLMFALVVAAMAFGASAAWADADPSTTGTVSTEAP